MKTTIIHISFLALVVFFLSCKKENISSSSFSTLNSQTSLKSPADEKILTFQPGPAKGQDAQVFWYEYDANIANTNFNHVHELDIEYWTTNGGLDKIRSYLKFTDLSQIPSNAIIESAILKLYGLNGTSISCPQGNSIYPGSPYDIYPNNSCLIERVTSDWDQTTITWNNQPLSDGAIKDTIPTSDLRWNYNVTVDVTNLVKIMVAQSANYGFSIRQTRPKIYRCMVFESSESGRVLKRPTLIVTYITPN